MPPPLAGRQEQEKKMGNTMLVLAMISIQYYISLHEDVWKWALKYITSEMRTLSDVDVLLRIVVN